MADKATIEIDWDHKIVGVSVHPMDLDARADKAVETSNAQIIAQLASKYAHDLMKLSPEELRERHLQSLSGLFSRRTRMPTSAMRFNGRLEFIVMQMYGHKEERTDSVCPVCQGWIMARTAIPYRAAVSPDLYGPGSRNVSTEADRRTLGWHCGSCFVEFHKLPAA